MKMKYLNILLLTLVSLLFFSCAKKSKLIDSPLKQEFVENCVLLGLYTDSKPIYVYDEHLYQMSVNPQRKSFRLQTDIQSTYLNITIDKIVDEGGFVTVKLERFASGKDVHTVCKMQCLKASPECLWLWDEERSISVICPRY